MTTNRRINAVAAVVGLLCAGAGASAAAQARPAHRDAGALGEGREWSMRYEEGTESIDPGAKVRVRVTGDKLICRAQEKEEGFSVPVEQITEIVYDFETWRASRDVITGWQESVATEPRLVVPAAVVAATVLPVAHAWKRKRHYIELIWEENGVGRRAAFSVGKREYESLLAALEMATGLERRELAGERRELRETLREEVRKHMEACHGSTCSLSLIGRTTERRDWPCDR